MSGKLLTCITPECGALVTARGRSFCGRCRQEKRVREGNECADCGRPIVAGYCPECQEQPPTPNFQTLQRQETGAIL